MAVAARAWKQVAARVREHRAYGPGFRWLELEVPVGFAEPVAGQFVQLLLDFPSPVLLPRPMSVASVSKRGARLTVGFLYAPVGAGTRALAQLAEGATLHMTGPLGRGYPLDERGTPVLVAGGRVSRKPDWRTLVADDAVRAYLGTDMTAAAEQLA